MNARCLNSSCIFFLLVPFILVGDSQEVNQCPWMSRILNYFTKNLTESVGKQMASGDYY